MHAGDPIWMKALLGVHIAAGVSSFVLAPVALATAKGGKQHRRWGMVYLWSMGVVAATALPMALYRPVLFLALVAIFSFYMAFAGYRVTRLKELARGGSAAPVDWIAGMICFSASVPDWVWCVSSGVGAGAGDRGDRVRVYRITSFDCGDVEVCEEAEGEDVLVVLAPGEHDWKLHCCVDGVFGDDAVSCLSSCGSDFVAVADDRWGAGDCADDCLLQEEVRSASKGRGVDQAVWLGRSARFCGRTPTVRDVL